MRESVEKRIVPMRHNLLNLRPSMFLYGFIGILCLVRTIESGPLKESNESRGTLQSNKGQEEEVGNPSEIAYQAWLLIDGHPDSQPLGGLDSASLLRRIKPKSIFVAPNLTACPEGYQDDTMNRCVKDVNIDHQAHKGFLVQRLQAIFGHKSHGTSSSSSLSSSSSSSSSSIPSGPLQLNIPLIMAAPIKPPREKINFQLQTPEESTSTTISPKIILEHVKVTNNDDKNDNQDNENKQEAIVTVYELNEDESTFFLGNKSSGNTVENDKNRDSTILVPVAELNDDGNSHFTSIDNNDKNHNLTILVGGSIDKNNEGTYEDTPSRIKEDTNDDKTNIRPTVVLVLSPTKVPSIVADRNDLIVAHNSSLGQVIIKMENVTTSNSTKEIIRVSVPDAIASSTTADINRHSTEDLTTKINITSSEDEFTESSEIYDAENYEDSTEIDNVDDDDDDDEILKHSEAGITVTLPTPGQRVTDNSPTIYNDKDLAGSSEISGEVSINRDFVRETTLVDFNISKTANSTKKPETLVAKDILVPNSSNDFTNDKLNEDIPIAKVEKLSPDDISKVNESLIQRLLFPAKPIEQTIQNEQPIWTENSDSTETMIASSTNDAQQTVLSREQPKFHMASYSSSKKRADQHLNFETTTKIPNKLLSTIPNVDNVYDYYPARNPYDLPVDDGVAVVRTIDEQRYPHDNHKHDQNFFPSQHRDYVNLNRHAQPNYVRFPSQEANSIHPNDYKERRPYNRYQQQLNNYGRISSVTKNHSTQDIRQKQSYWWVPPGWPMDIDQRPSNNDRSRTPMLLRFWTKMPLVKDPSLNYQQHPTYPTSADRTSSSTRRVNYYKEMSTHDFNRAFVRKTLPSAIGG